MKTSEVLNKAADLIEERGWGQGPRTWTTEGAELCLEGAIAAAMGKNANRSPRFENGIWPEDIQTCPAGAAVRDHLEWTHAYLCMWNDKTERTADEVIEVLRACAVIEAAREEQDAAWETYAEQVSV